MLKRILFKLAVWGSGLLGSLSFKLGRIAALNLTAGEPRRSSHVPGRGGLEKEVDREIDEFKQEMLSGIIEMGGTVVKEVMIPRTEMVCVDAAFSLDEVLSAVIGSEHSRIPVYEGTVDNIVGMLYSKDLIKIMAGSKDGFDVRKIIRPTYFIPETKPLTVLLREFQQNRVHIAIVVDEYGGTAGLITLEDILEEIIGEIQDEYDAGDEQVIKLDNGDLLVDARMDIEMVEELLGMDIEKEDYESLGGLAITMLGHVPRQGESFSLGDFRFVVEKATDRKAVKIRIMRTRDGDNNVSR